MYYSTNKTFYLPLISFE